MKALTWGMAADGKKLTLKFEVDGLPDQRFRIEGVIEGDDIETAARRCREAAQDVCDWKTGKSAARLAELKEQIGYPQG